MKQSAAVHYLISSEQWLSTVFDITLSR